MYKYNMYKSPYINPNHIFGVIKIYYIPREANAYHFRFRDSKNNFSWRAWRNPTILNTSLHKLIENSSYNLAQPL